jgi:hypothetical protein
MAKQQINPAQQKNTPTTGTNAGASGGTTNYLNLGGLKICWGATNSATIASGGAVNYNITFPITYTTVPTVNVVALGGGAYSDWIIPSVATVSTTALLAYLHNSGAGTSGSEQLMWIAIGA